MSVLSQFFGGNNQIPIEVFAVGGGAAANGPATPSSSSGGGGGGQVIYKKTIAKFGKTYPIIIGAGGAFPSGAGVPTILTDILTAGGGNDFGGSSPGSSGAPIPTVITATFTDEGFYSQFPGGASGPFGAGGGGGGAGGFGGTALSSSPLAAGNGGSAIPGAAIGISTFTFSSGGAGVPGGGTAGTVPFPGANGGSGGSFTGSGNGGGLIIRYPTEYSAATVIGNTTAVPSQPGYYVYRWTSGPGSITFNR